MTQIRKPFGLTLACKVASDAIRESVAPVSVVLYNLIALQKDTLFPKSLDVQFFANSKRVVSEEDKRGVTKILDALRGPHIDTPELLEGFVKKDWVVKKAPPVQPIAKKVVTKPVLKKAKTKPVVKKEVVAPVVTIKKNRMI